MEFDLLRRLQQVSSYWELLNLLRELEERVARLEHNCSRNAVAPDGPCSGLGGCECEPDPDEVCDGRSVADS